MAFLWLSLAALLATTSAVTYDRGLSRSLHGISQNDVLIFTFRKVQLPKRNENVTHQTLMSVGDPTASQLSFSLDRLHGKVYVDTISDGKSHRDSVDTPAPITPRTHVQSIVIEMHQKTRVANVYFNCDLLGSLPLLKNVKELSKDTDSLEVYRAKRADVSIDGKATIVGVLKKLRCKSDTPSGDFQAQSNQIYTYKRGDIPISSADQTTTLLVNTMSDLADTIRQLQVEIQTQREETVLLREALLNCEACKAGRKSRFLGR